MKEKDSVRLVKIKSIEEQNRGVLSVVEFEKDIPFQVKRAFYIYDVPEGIIRGRHAHKNASHFIICLSGKMKFYAENDNKKYEFVLSTPREGILFAPMTWVEYEVIEKPFIGIVFSSESFEDAEYINNR